MSRWRRESPSVIAASDERLHVLTTDHPALAYVKGAKGAIVQEPIEPGPADAEGPRSLIDGEQGGGFGRGPHLISESGDHLPDSRLKSGGLHTPTLAREGVE